MVGVVGDESKLWKLCSLQRLRLMKLPLFDLMNDGDSERQLKEGDSARNVFVVNTLSPLHTVIEGLLMELPSLS
jgi:hypothetical protein